MDCCGMEGERNQAPGTLLPADQFGQEAVSVRIRTLGEFFCRSFAGITPRLRWFEIEVV